MKLKIGDAAPNFNLPSNDGKISLDQFHNKKNVVLYFYPKDDTPGCTQEAKDFRDKIHKFSEFDTVILGVSGDGLQRHANFKKKYDLPFSLISDETRDELIKTYGVWIEKSMFGKPYMGIDRATFLINKKGYISHIWRKVKVKGHVDEVLVEAEKLFEDFMSR